MYIRDVNQYKYVSAPIKYMNRKKKYLYNRMITLNEIKDLSCVIEFLLQKLSILSVKRHIYSD